MIKVLMNGIECALMEYSLNINEQINERSTCSFSVRTSIEVAFEKGVPVTILYGEEKVFVGYINTVTHKDYFAKEPKRIHGIECVDVHYLVDKRIFVRGFTDITAGDIVKTLVTELLSEEGVSFSVDSIESGFHIQKISFSYKYANEVLDQLAEMCGYIWYVDYDKVLHFYKPQTRGVKGTIEDKDIINDSLMIENKNNQYRNRQMIKGAVGETEKIIQTFKGNGVDRAFTLGYRLGDKPDIYVNGQKLADEEIGLKGENETACFLYQKQDWVILHNEKEPPLTESDTITIEYFGVFPIIAVTELPGEIERNKALGSGTGIVEVVDHETDIHNVYAASLMSVGRLEKYGANTFSVKFTMCRYESKEREFIPYEIGDVIHFNTSQLRDKDYIIESIEIVDDLKFAFYHITAVKGSLSESWTKAFGKGLQRRETVANIDLAEQETVILSRSFSKNWMNSENPNIMRQVVPNEALYPNRVTPTFKFSERVSFVEVIDINEKVMTRNIRSVQSESSGDILSTYFYIDPFQAIGYWKQLKFYGGNSAGHEFGSGVVIDTVEVDLVKYELEGVQISRTDYKEF